MRYVAVFTSGTSLNKHMSFTFKFTSTSFTYYRSLLCIYRSQLKKLAVITSSTFAACILCFPNPPPTPLPLSSSWPLLLYIYLSLSLSLSISRSCSVSLSPPRPSTPHPPSTPLFSENSCPSPSPPSALLLQLPPLSKPSPPDPQLTSPISTKRTTYSENFITW